MIVKIHGCADTYRHACHSPNGEAGTLKAVLPSLVFTFREIQNWRGDSWSRDQLLTLRRTRTMAFCIYSTADPVLHDTIRTVYEEMAARANTAPPTIGRARRRVGVAGRRRPDRGTGCAGAALVGAPGRAGAALAGHRD